MEDNTYGCNIGVMTGDISGKLHFKAGFSPAVPLRISASLV